MSKLAFTKLHGCGNDFVLIDSRKFENVLLTKELVKKISDRHTGIGFDQLLWLENPKSPDCYASYLIYNADGSCFTQCGNGLRCLGRYIWENDPKVPSEIILGANNERRVLKRDSKGDISVNVGSPNFDPAKVPFKVSEQADSYDIMVEDQEITLTAMTLDNAHVAVFVDDLDQLNMDKLGPGIAYHAQFPEGTNVHFVQLTDNPKELKTRTFERGVGETLACGTGACTSAIAAFKHFQSSPPFIIHQRGGDLDVNWSSFDEGIWLTGPTAVVFEGYIDLEELDK